MISNSGYLKLFNGIATSIINFQSVRYKRFRKPLWMGRAKTKMFKVVPRKVIPVEEERELIRLHNNYRTQVRSIRTFLEANWKEKTEETIDHEAVQRKFEEDLQRTLLLNKEWAEQLRPVRESFTENQLKMYLDNALEKIEQKRVKKETQTAKTEELVRQVKADAKNFITQDNIDEAIDRALENTVDYNYALSLKGEKIV